MDNIYIKLNELMDELDKLDSIKELELLKKSIPLSTKELVREYNLTNDVNIKKELFKDEFYVKFISKEQELNYLIMSINKLFRSNYEDN